ncbi:SDR family NAD(P)-dependent oxidoreductase [Nocardioides sp. LHD-245]|uniref:SDR family NAD(P)-dependent oxidoreductase n=1 Tax=Nocardioides sp. LHD-245 TaxID=3051387 RepID=UPI0027E20317|nr:SDR family NAD(P)-dependent oxidoreductase [Nocardioides sp. LHD-245]
MHELAGRTALVTGGGSGIGARIAALLATQGARVAVADLDATAAERIATGLPGPAGTHLGIRADVAAEDDVVAMVQALHEADMRPDLLINNAATCSDLAYEELPLTTWRRDLDVSLTGAFLTTRHLSADLRRSGGSVVNIASVNAVRSFGNEAYSAAKAGLVSLTQGLAVRWASSRVRVNAVLPGTIRTPIWDERLSRDPDVLVRAARMYPLGRIGEPEDVAQAVAFLVSDRAAWITGVALPVDGGLLAVGSTAFASDIEEIR